MINSAYIVLIPLLPFISFLVIGLLGRKKFPSLCGILGTLSLLGAFVLSGLIAYNYFSVIGRTNGVYLPIVPIHMEWLQFSQGLAIDIGILLDPISSLMLLIVTFISLMVHIYSLGYMKDEPRMATYFSFLSLFTFSMLGLVVASNLFQLYIFWELVGLSSFLLIGFYYEKNSAAAAAKKAFIVTRFADLGFLIGILLLSGITKTLDFQLLIARATDASYMQGNLPAAFLGVSAISWAMALLFIGGAGKSAMFPLHIWLPDAMEGPTPVSALIHAATMVVAGVYLVARLFPIYALSTPAVLHVIAYVGLFSSFFAALVACTQTDIKRVLAYSTISQIGFMLFAIGVSGYGGENGLGYMASMFHLFTHALFKALLFLGAGAIIHFVHSNEMKDMGGLRKKMPITHITFLIGCLAISGIPPFAGFFSKEEILMATWQSNKFIFGVAVFTAGLTAFYIFRLYLNIFWNTEFKETQHEHNAVNASGKVAHHGEGPLTVLLPLLVLAFLALIAGFVPFGNFVTSDGKILESIFHPLFSILPVLVAVAGIVFALQFYAKKNDLSDKFINGISGFYKSCYRKFYIDEVYQFVTHRILFNLVGRPAAWFDKNVVDGFINNTGEGTAELSEMIKPIQSGKLQDYALYFFAGVAGIALLCIYFLT